MHIRKADRDAAKGMALLLAEGLRLAWKMRHDEVPVLTAADDKRLKAVKKRAKDLGVS